MLEALLVWSRVSEFESSPRHTGNAFAERFVHSIKSECLNRMIFFGPASLHHTISQFMAHYHVERNHQGLENKLIRTSPFTPSKSVHRRQRLGGMLNYYYRTAA
jgi:putative transposase